MTEPLSRQLYHLKVAEGAIVYSETHEGAHLVEAVDACGTGIDVEGVDGAVVHHLEDMGVPADEEGGRAHEEGAADRGVVVARVSANVLDEHVGSLDGEAVDLWVAQPDIAPIDIAMHSAEGTEGFERLGHLERTNVSGMPHLIALGKVPCVAFVPMAVSVRE